MNNHVIDRLPVRATRALAAGIVVASGAACLVHGGGATAPLFPRPEAVPSVIGSAPSPRYTPAVEHARTLVRAAVTEQNLPGVSVAVGADGTVVWTEGFGWRDVETRTPVTPDTRFNIGTAASAVAAAVAPLGLRDTGTDPPSAWSPEHVGEPEEDFPLFTIARDVLFRPLGFAPALPLPGGRARCYVPESGDNPRRGRRLMPMRDLAWRPGGMAFYSTPSDLVRFALATNHGRVDGTLAGGTVMSLTSGRDSGIVVAVTSNMAHANTRVLARHVGDAFAARTR
jgi:CubicO group peptidase (beta-lactamase class C family)